MSGDVKTPAEIAVRELDELRRRGAQLDDWMRDMRLGRHAGTHRPPRLQWLEGVFGFDWVHSKPEPLPQHIQDRFYTFLVEESARLGDEIRKAQERLEALR